MAREYLTPAELVNFYDSRRVLELANDLGDGSATLSDLSNVNSTPYLIVSTAVRSVSAEIDSAVQVGNRYARTDLEQLILDLSDPIILADSVLLEAAKKRAAILKQMVADLTFGRLMSRRGYTAQAMEDMAPQYAGALKLLLDLSNGRRIFDLDAPKNAGMPARVSIGIDGLSPFAPVQASPLFGDFGRTSVFPLFPIR